MSRYCARFRNCWPEFWLKQTRNRECSINDFFEASGDLTSRQPVKRFHFTLGLAIELTHYADHYY